MTRRENNNAIFEMLPFRFEIAQTTCESSLTLDHAPLMKPVEIDTGVIRRRSKTSLNSSDTECI